MNRTKKRVNPLIRRRIALLRRLLVPAGIIVMIWVTNSVWRSFFYQQPPTESWLAVEGNFAGHPTESAELETAFVLTPPAPAESGYSPFSEPQQAAFAPVKVYIPSSCVMMTQDASALHNGKLLRLDSEHPYSGYEGEMTTISESKGGYNVHFSSLELMPCTLDAMDKMAQGYIASTGLHDLLAYSTTEISEHSLYAQELPDRETGYCIDLAIEYEDGSIDRFYSRGVWLENNAYRYGFVFSYTEADEEATGIENAPYHLRFVGRVHAGLMHESGLSLAAYQEMLKAHPTDDPLFYEDDGQTYSVYYVPKSLGSTDVPVPKNGNYEISGDNETGFVVVAEGKIK